MVALAGNPHLLDPPRELFGHAPLRPHLQFLVEQGTRQNLPLLVCGPENDPESMRLAMRAGARDYLPENVTEDDLVASLARIREEILRSGAGGTGKLIVILNGKGGSGASFLATNLAHGLVVDGGHAVTLFDLDLQFGGLYRYLDLAPKVGMIEALEAAHSCLCHLESSLACSSEWGGVADGSPSVVAAKYNTSRQKIKSAKYQYNQPFRRAIRR